VVQPPRLLSEIRFGAFVAYSPHGTSQVSTNSRKVRDVIKDAQPDGLRQLFDRLARDFSETPLGEVLGQHVTLVPAPRSSPLLKDALWPAQRMADELRKRGLAQDVVPLLTRAKAVPKSAFAKASDRPTPQQHLASLAIDPLLVNLARITIVDDVVTRGATLLAAASLIAASFPEAEVRTFAVLRTVSFEDVAAIVEPCVGTIRLTGNGKTWREP
jgi:predicted amidophosphoribosyltransferase